MNFNRKANFKFSLAQFLFSIITVVGVAILFSCKEVTPKVAALADIKIYPAPEGIELSNDFKVEIKGKAVPLYKVIEFLEKNYV